MGTYQQHPTALVASPKIGAGTRIWAFVNISSGAVIGTDCNICDRVFIEDNVFVGNRVTIKCGVSLWDGVTLEDDVFVGPGVAFTNDRFPRSRIRPREYVRTLVRRGASLGANATILGGHTIGMNAMVGAGSVVTADVPPNAIVRGNPARIAGYIESRAETASPSTKDAADLETATGGVKQVRLIQMPEVSDLRGILSFGEVGAQLPFVPQRYFVIYGVPSKDVRGEHAHRRLEQLLLCVAGNCRVMVDDGRCREEFKLDSPEQALYVPAMCWAAQYKYSQDAVLLVFASEKYDATDYVRDYDEFLRLSQDTVLGGTQPA